MKTQVRAICHFKRDREEQRYYLYLEARDASSLAHSSHKEGLNGNIPLIASLDCLSFSRFAVFLRSFIY